ncbi:aminotransferase class IV family protein [Erythrobacter sp.]|uniref:aminotransferase class IV family protein n=1 Tax=Erythrobacter sp. TaxID=1042 RepID=UPI001B09722F|nr:aminotransferase class IV family protein [Erythrobacter sp.]MBO6527467.1 aminotransferase class IV family protein [Erythrobacter sp.]MBO6530850.1 aminotransferase class IV family protein [Erythrobacter sp.]
MADESQAYVVQRNGEAADRDDLAGLAFAGYAHFTAMQVRGGKIRGLDLHLERLRFASLRLFGNAMPDDRVRAYLRAAIEAGPSDLTLMATMYSRAGEFTAAATHAEPEVLVRTSPADNGPAGPLELAAVEHERFMPTVKHVGELAKTYFRRQPADDAAFIDRQGRLSEATIWNLAFWDGETVIWPRAEVLIGTTMGIVRRQLDRLGIPQCTREVTLADLPFLAGAVVMNSWSPGVALRRIDTVPLPDAPDFVTLLHRAYEAEPFVSP